MLVVGDALDALFLGCFLFGLLFAGVLFLFGAGHVGVHVHLPGHGHGYGHGHPVGRQDGVGPLTLSSASAFLAWFGGIGYLVRQGTGGIEVVSIAAGAAGGVVAALTVGWLLSQLLRGSDAGLNPEAFRLPGTLARVTSSIRPGGTGKVVYEQAGVHQVAAARAIDGGALVQGSEVVNVRCERGFAYVEALSAFLGERHADLTEGGGKQATEGQVPAT